MGRGHHDFTRALTRRELVLPRLAGRGIDPLEPRETRQPQKPFMIPLEDEPCAALAVVAVRFPWGPCESSSLGIEEIQPPRRADPERSGVWFGEERINHVVAQRSGIASDMGVATESRSRGVELVEA